MYFILVPGDGTLATIHSIAAAMERLPQVRAATPFYIPPVS